MAKEMPAAHREILRIANELGYFPLRSYLKELSQLAAASAFADNPQAAGPVSDEVFHRAVKLACEAKYGAATPSAPALPAKPVVTLKGGAFDGETVEIETGTTQVLMFSPTEETEKLPDGSQVVGRGRTLRYVVDWTTLTARLTER